MHQNIEFLELTKMGFNSSQNYKYFPSDILVTQKLSDLKPKFKYFLKQALLVKEQSMLNPERIIFRWEGQIFEERIKSTRAKMLPEYR